MGAIEDAQAAVDNAINVQLKKIEEANNKIAALRLARKEIK